MVGLGVVFFVDVRFWISILYDTFKAGVYLFYHCAFVGLVGITWFLKICAVFTQSHTLPCAHECIDISAIYSVTAWRVLKDVIFNVLVSTLCVRFNEGMAIFSMLEMRIMFHHSRMGSTAIFSLWFDVKLITNSKL